MIAQHNNRLIFDLRLLKTEMIEFALYVSNCNVQMTKMEDFLFQTLKMGFLLLTLSLISGYLYISDFFTQQLAPKTILSVMAWIGFAGILFAHIVFGIRGKLIVLLTQIAFAVLLLSYFGTKFFIEIQAI